MFISHCSKVLIFFFFFFFFVSKSGSLIVKFYEFSSMFTICSKIKDFELPFFLKSL